MAREVRYESMPATLQSVQVAPSQPMMCVVSSGTTKKEKYKSVLFCMGVTELILGISSGLICVVTLMIAVNTFRNGFTYVSQGLWCGAFLVASGVLGMKTRTNPSPCMYNANMVMSILTSVFMGVLVCLSSIASASAYWAGLLVPHAILAMIGVAGMIVSIIHAAYCCAGVCCIRSQDRIMYSHAAQQPQMVAMQLVNGQYVMVPFQPVPQQSYPVGPYQPVAAPVTQFSAPVADPGPLPAQMASTSGIQQPESHNFQTLQEAPPEYTTLPPCQK